MTAIRMNIFVKILYLVIANLIATTVQAGTSPFADTVIINGKVITADADRPEDISTADALAIQGTRKTWTNSLQ